MIRLVLALLVCLAATVSSVAAAGEPVSIADCKGLADPIEVVWCEVRFHGDVRPCDNLSTHDNRLFCMAMARKSSSGCNQVMNDELQARCYRDIGIRPGSGQATGATGSTRSSRLSPTQAPSAGSGYSTDPTPATQPTTSHSSSRSSGDTSKCDAEQGELKSICLAKVTRNADHCNAIGHHDNKLYCYAVVRGSAGGCDQVMDDGLKARCHAEVRNR